MDVYSQVKIPNIRSYESRLHHKEMTVIMRKINTEHKPKKSAMGEKSEKKKKRTKQEPKNAC